MDTTTATTPTLAALAERIAPMLAPGDYKLNLDNCNLYGDVAKLTRPDGSGFTIYKDRSGPKLEVRGIYPTGPDGCYARSCLAYREEMPSIGVSSERYVSAIVKDIERRFMPEYTALLARARQAKADYETHCTELAAALALLQSAVPYGKLKSSQYGHTPDKLYSYEKITIEATPSYHGTTVDIKINSLPLDLAYQVLALASTADAKVVG